MNIITGRSLFGYINKNSLCDFAATTAQSWLALLCLPESRNAQVCIFLLPLLSGNLNFVWLR